MATHLRFSILICGLCTGLLANAATLQGTVVDDGGKGIVAVVWVDAPSGEMTKAPPVLEVHQRDKAFVPRVLDVEVGQAVRFPNDDHIFHNVFSASKGNAFDLGLFKADAKYDETTLSKVDKGPEAGSMKFKQPGRVDVFCNIHPSMSAVVMVIPHAYHARSGEDGSFRLRVPAKGPYRLKAIDESGNEASAEAPGAGAPVKIVFRNHSVATPEHNRKDGKPYSEGDSGGTAY